jgi:hypothetical protein
VKSFKFKESAAIRGNTSPIKEGVHCAAIIQVAQIGLQRPFNRDAEPEPTLAVAFELESGEQVAKRMKVSTHPSSGCYSLFTSAFPDLEETDDEALELTDLLGKSVMIEVEVRDGKWPRVTEIMPLEEGFDPVTPKAELLAFDADEMDREVYLKLHRDIRSWTSKRIRQQ